MAGIWRFRLTDDSSATALAASEFKRLMAEFGPEAEVTGGEGLFIGLNCPVKVPEVNDPEFDDGIAIEVRDCKGSITGTNPRSVLIALYRFFTEAGCAFLRPGRDGEYIPRKNSAEVCVSISEKAAYKHRGICIEGSTSYENVASMVDYLPKIGMNTYFTQFFRPYQFFDRWYNHSGNPLMTKTPIAPETVDRFLADYSVLLKQRGLIHQAVGHGWTAKCLGLDANGWYTVDTASVPEEKRPFMALMNGKRGLFEPKGDGSKGVAINTNLCYTNPEVRESFVSEIVSYVQTHPDISYVHIWLADHPNNHCECENCRKTTPSDLYVELLNEADARLTEKGLKTKLVFLIYQELLWPPVSARFNNPDRFTLMFAPISRTYTYSYDVNAKGQMRKFELNKNEMPHSIGDSLEYLRAWHKLFTGDGFVFDYHYMWTHNYDLGNCDIAKVLNQDIKSLKSLGLDGLISCQLTRCHFPTGLGNYVMGRTLWQGDTDYEKVKNDYFTAAFGEDGKQVREYLETLSFLSMPEYSRRERPEIDAEAAERFSRIPKLVDDFMPVIEAHLEDEDLSRQRSWFYLSRLSPLAKITARMLYARATGNRDEAMKLWEEVKNAARRTELYCQPVFDAMEFIVSFNR